ncbi:dihydrolipoamide acetyltransferase family protein [Nocardioides pacificus]
MSDFTMPSLGADMEEGTLLEWLVRPGDAVHKGDIVAVVDTSKAAVEVEVFTDGVVGRLLVEPGTVVPVGAVLATIEPVALPTAQRPGPGRPEVHSPLVRRLARERGVDLGLVTGTGRDGSITRADVTQAAEAAGEQRPAPPRQSASPSSPTASPAGRPAGRITPYARRLAAELGIDVSTLARPDGGPIQASDVHAAADVGPAAGPAAPVTGASKADQMRATIAALMSRSKREIPHYYLSLSIDLGRALGWMRERNLTLPVTERMVPAALMLRATALAAAETPALNGFWVEGTFQPGSGVHLGVAVSLRGGGLVAPALHHADQLSLAEVMAGMRDLVTRARSGRLRGSELRDPTITVTNLGDQGVDAVYGVIYPPQVALVGFGRVVERPWAVDGLLGVRPVTELTLSADHRATDGFTGARFLAAIDQHLQRPEEL